MPRLAYAFPSPVTIIDCFMLAIPSSSILKELAVVAVANFRIERPILRVPPLWITNLPEDTLAFLPPAHQTIGFAVLM